jgi:hypothetical protein
MRIALTSKCTEKSSKTVRAGIKKYNRDPDLVRQFSWNTWLLCIFQILLQANLLKKATKPFGFFAEMTTFDKPDQVICLQDEGAILSFISNLTASISSSMQSIYRSKQQKDTL